MNSREECGQVIAQRKNQIHRIDNTHYQVNSQSSNKQYDIISTEHGWTCPCPDHRFRHVCCKHIHAVEISLSIRDNVKEDIVISEVKIDSCKHCNSSNIKKAGIRKNKSGNIQMFKCKDCNAKFSISLGFEGMRATPEQITMAMNLYFNGESSRKVAQSLTLTGVKVSHITIQKWNKKGIIYLSHV